MLRTRVDVTEKCERCGTPVRPFDLGELLRQVGGDPKLGRPLEWVEQDSSVGPGYVRFQMTTHTKARCDAARAQIVGPESSNRVSMIGAFNDVVRWT